MVIRYESLDMEYNPKSTAVIVVDMQNDFCHPDGALYAEGSEEAIEGVNDVLGATEGVALTIFTQDTHDNNAAEFEQWGEHCVHDTWGQEFHDGLDRQPDRAIEKNTYDAFHNTDLPRLLQLHGIDTVIICGTLVNVCVQETASSAALHGYDVSVVEDAVGYLDDEQREASLDHIDFLIGDLVETTDL